MYCVIMCCIVSPRLHGINEKYALLAVSGCFSHVLFCVSLPLVVLFLLLGFSLVSPEFASLCCVSSLCLLLFPVFSSLTFPPVLFTYVSEFTALFPVLFWLIFSVFLYLFFTHLEKKPNLILRLSFLIFHLWPVVHDPSSVAHRKEIFISTFW